MPESHNAGFGRRGHVRNCEGCQCDDILELDPGRPEATLSLSLAGLCTGDGAASRLCGSVSVIAGMLSAMFADEVFLYWAWHAGCATAIIFRTTIYVLSLPSNNSPADLLITYCG